MTSKKNPFALFAHRTSASCATGKRPRSPTTRCNGTEVVYVDDGSATEDEDERFPPPPPSKEVNSLSSRFPPQLPIQEKSVNVTTTCAPPTPSSTSCTKERGVFKTAAGSKRFDDDDDDLCVLGGGMSKGTSPVTTAPPPPLPLTVSKRIRQGVAIGSLDWHSKLSSRRRLIMELFVKQLAFTLNTHPALLQALSPFFRSKALGKLLSTYNSDEAEQGSVWSHPPPPITAQNTGSLEGYTLRPYQVEGVQFLMNGFCNGLSMILADDMGLGKTAQISSFLSALHVFYGIQGPHLLIVPLTTISTWIRELSRWAPHLHIVKYHGTEKIRREIQSDHHSRLHVFITTAQTFVADRSFFRKRVWVTAIVDEAHILKGDKTNISLQVRRIDACCRIAVTGTPVHNRVQEVWNLMAFLFPFLGEGGAVKGSMNDEEEEAEAIQQCASVLSHIMLRRTKTMLDLDIPPRVDVPTIFVQPTSLQQSLFDMIAAAALGKKADVETIEDVGSDKAESEDDVTTAVGTTAVSNRSLMSLFSRQRHLCNHPLTLRILLNENRNSSSLTGSLHSSVAAAAKARALSFGDTAMHALGNLSSSGIPLDEAHIIQPSAKMQQLDHMLSQMKAEGHRVLIFSNFTSTLDLLEGLCLLREYGYERLDGSTTRVERELSMIRFNHAHSKAFVFLLTTTAGGVGVTLTGADTVILYDAHYNPQIDRQAADRAHRLGQTRPVHVYRLCVANSLEEHIQAIAMQKAQLGDIVVDSSSSPTSASATGGGGELTKAKKKVIFSADEVRRLFEKYSTQQHDRSAELQLSQEESEMSQQCELLTDLMSMLDDEDDGGDDEDGYGRRRQLCLPEARSGRDALPHTHLCFDCGEKMRPFEPLLHCIACTKAFHRSCADADKDVKDRQWSCPRHECSECGKTQRADGAIFACWSCPASYCFDCLDPRYLNVDAATGRFDNICDSYVGMEEEGMPKRRSMFYITCLDCAGVTSSTEGSTSRDSDEDASGSSTDDYQS